LTSFQKITAHFSKTFHEPFLGGSAALELTQGPDVLESASKSRCALRASVQNPRLLGAKARFRQRDFSLHSPSQPGAVCIMDE
jgi:hypothetical protein